MRFFDFVVLSFFTILFILGLAWLVISVPWGWLIAFFLLAIFFTLRRMVR